MATPPAPPDPPDQPDPDRADRADHLRRPARERARAPAGGATASGGRFGSGSEPRRLTRSSSDKVLGGVAGGLGRYFDIDPIIFRIGFVVLTLAGGAGLLAYGAAWLFVPADPVAGSSPLLATAR